MKQMTRSITRCTPALVLVALASFAGCVAEEDSSQSTEWTDDLNDSVSNYVGSDYCRTKSAVRTNAGDTFDCLDAVGSNLIRSEYFYDIREMVYPLDGNTGIAFEAAPHGPWRVDCEEDECEGQRPVEDVSRYIGLSLRDSRGNVVESDGNALFRRITVMTPSNRDDRTSKIILTPFWEGDNYLVDSIEIEADTFDGFELIVAPAAELPEDFEARIWFTMSAEYCSWDWAAGFCRGR